MSGDENIRAYLSVLASILEDLQRRTEDCQMTLDVVDERTGRIAQYLGVPDPVSGEDGGGV